MKKILSLTLSLLAIVGSARAQHWSYTEGQHLMETFVYADLVLDGETVNSEDLLSQYEVAAFIGDEVRAIGQVYIPQGTPAAIYLLRFRIEGEQEELGQAITFKAFHNEAEYDMEVRETPLPTFTGETLDPGAPSNPRHLYLTEPTDITLSDIVMNVGEEVDLLSKIAYNPEDAAKPNTAPEWTIVDKGYFTITDNTLKATAPNVNGAWLSVSIGSNLSARAKVTIYQPATGITQKQTELTVNVGENVKQLLDGTYTLVPDNTTDALEWSWEIGETSPIVNVRYNASNPGDVVFTGTVKGADGTVREVPAPITVTVHVVQPVTAITTPFTEPASGGDVNYLECSVGDDLTEYFVDGKAFTIAPANATNKEVNITLSNDADNAVVTIDANGTIKAAAEGESAIVVEAKDGSEARCLVYVKVHNDVQDIVIANETLSVLLTEEGGQDISGLVQGNISFLPANATAFYNYYVEVESNNSEVVAIGDLFNDTEDGPRVNVMAFANTEGTAKITVSIEKRDYLKSTFDSDRNYVTPVSKSFNVVVSLGVTGIDIDVPELVQFEDAGIHIMPQPGNATLDMSKVTVTASYVDNPSWNAATIGNVVESDDGAAMCSIEPLIPGLVTFTVTYDNGTDELITVTSDPQEVGYTLYMPDGWTWQTIPYGYPEFEESGLEGIFGDDLVEIRTQGEQLYNDSQYGYFGDTDLLTQNKCFKLKMANEAPAWHVFRGGSLGEGANVILRKGWNWVPSPYIFNRTFASAFSDMIFEEGDRFVGQDGFAEYNGNAWEGSLQGLTWSAGYLFYNAGDANRELAYTNEFNMGDQEEFYEEGSTEAYGARMQTKPFTYDARRFRDNMTIVAQLEGADGSDRYQAFAFVGDECRGRGISQNGKLFITVHANSGEQVSFKLYDELTGCLTDIDQTVTMQQMLGSLKAPFQMTSQTVTTGISTVESAQQQTECFDLNGRSAASSQKGLHLMRQADGSVRKMIRK